MPTGGGDAGCAPRARAGRRRHDLARRRRRRRALRGNADTVLIADFPDVEAYPPLRAGPGAPGGPGRARPSVAGPAQRGPVPDLSRPGRSVRPQPARRPQIVVLAPIPRLRPDRVGAWSTPRSTAPAVPRTLVRAVRAHRVRVRDVGEIAAGLPHLLGFRPRESVVLLSLGGDERPPGGADRAGRHPAARAQPVRWRRCWPGACAPTAPTARWSSWSPRRPTTTARDDRGLPHHDLVCEMCRALSPGWRARSRDALLVRAGRWWSYDCPTPAALPAPARPCRRG